MCFLNVDIVRGAVDDMTGFLWIQYNSTRRVVDDTDSVVDPIYLHSPSVDDVAEGCGEYVL